MGRAAEEGGRQRDGKGGRGRAGLVEQLEQHLVGRGCAPHMRSACHMRGACHNNMLASVGGPPRCCRLRLECRPARTEGRCAQLPYHLDRALPLALAQRLA
eukprot:7132988-Prymnesium_polylepis.1